MVIFMPYYRQRGQSLHSNTRTRPSTSLANGQNTSAATIRMNRCRFISNILCRFICSLFLLTIALFLFQLSIDNTSNQKEGSNIIAAILLTIAIISFIRTCQKLRRYYIILDTRRRLIQRLRERQQAYELALALNNSENAEFLRNIPSDLPSYKELFPSQPDLRDTGADSSLSLPPPSYDDFVETLVIPHSGARLPITAHPISLANTSSPLSSSQITTNANRCLWITDQARRPLCIRGSVTYV
ncbi:unnamed protein product [Adineta ricciae]|uniref:Uncharacterized protein n=1 Tax=Adineta ricciae TaxID=249248 RepID=A0A814A6N1_ADIRI|nr:unnamed protein product [Adineta ricciae]CAF0910356.1 unnamed protein product [Adineta ricciae]